uniref:Uncharacterized protein n=1 Tax=Leersia perrieri TaxID=77586 RepID=A0A0D9X8G5_9ORYZ
MNRRGVNGGGARTKSFLSLRRSQHRDDFDDGSRAAQARRAAAVRRRPRRPWSPLSLFASDHFRRGKWFPMRDAKSSADNRSRQMWRESADVQWLDGGMATFVWRGQVVPVKAAPDANDDDDDGALITALTPAHIDQPHRAAYSSSRSNPI